MNVVLICHEKDKWEGGQVTTQTFDGWDKLEYELHLCLRIVKQASSRKAKVMKSRLAEFPDAATFDWSYAEFAKRYGRDIIEAAAVPMVPAAPEQVAKLRTLVEALHIPGDVTDKWREKAGVEAWDEMDATTIDKCIAYCQAKLPKADAA